jgi:uncharacterized protein YdaU (DUF1376 family)
MKYYSHHMGDFDRATRHLDRIERSIYRDLIEVYYDTEQQLILDISALCRKIIARTQEEVTAVEQVLNEFFTKTHSGWYHDRCEAVIDEYRLSNSQKSIAGKASAAKKALKRQQAINVNSTDVEQSLNGSQTEDQRYDNGISTNHKPITNNHKPITNKEQKTIPSDEDLFSGVAEQVVVDFKKLRNKKKAAITKTAIDGIVREAEKAGLSLEAALMICCERGWTGFDADWVLKPKQGSPRNAPPNGFLTPNEKQKAFADRLTGKSNERNDNIIDINERPSG